MADQPLKDTIRENASGPLRAQGDAGSVQQHGLRDQIEADRYLATQQAVRRKRLGLRLGRIRPGGAE